MATPAQSSLHISDLILQASPVVQAVMLILLFASIYSWYLIAKLHMSYKNLHNRMNIFKNVLVGCRAEYALQQCTAQLKTHRS